MILALQSSGVPWQYAIPIGFAMIPLALSGWMVGRYTPKSDTERLERALTDKVDNLTTMLKEHIDRSDRIQERQEARYATVEQMNGVGKRLDELKELVGDIATESRTAFTLAQASNQSTQHLGQRLEDVIGDAIKRLEREVEKLGETIRKAAT